MSVKERVLHAIQQMSDDIDFRDVTEGIALLSAIQEAESDIAAGKLISDEEMKARIPQWTAN